MSVQGLDEYHVRAQDVVVLQGRSLIGHVVRRGHTSTVLIACSSFADASPSIDLQASQSTPGTGTVAVMHVAAMTMVRNEADMLPRWVRYYGAQLGAANLVVIDDQSNDGSTDDPGCTVLRMPVRGGARAPFATHKTTIANKLAAGLLEMFDAVLFTDVDEFIVPDPRRYAGLVEYLEKNPDEPVLAPTGLNLVHVVGNEPPLDPDQPLLDQRRHVKFVGRMCKPAIKRVPVRWANGTHGVARPFEVRDDLYLFHAKFADFDRVMRVHQDRYREFVTRGAGSGASWRLPPDELRHRYERWIEGARHGEVARLEDVDISGVVRRQPNGAYSSMGGQLKAMESQQLLRVPDDFGSPV